MVIGHLKRQIKKRNCKANVQAPESLRLQLQFQHIYLKISFSFFLKWT